MKLSSKSKLKIFCLMLISASIFTRFIKLKTLGITFKSTFLIALNLLIIFLSPVLAGDKLEKMTELPSIQLSNSKIATTQSTLEKTIKDDIVILYKNGKKDNVAKLDLDKSDFIAGSSLNGQVDVLRVNNSNDTNRLIKEISKNENVLAVDNDAVGEAQTIPNDPLFDNKQTYLKNIGYDKTWEFQSKNQVKVAVIDTGINTGHEDFSNDIERTGKNYIEGEEFVDYKGHGTMVASIIAAETNNSIGYAGISGLSNVKVVPYKIGDKEAHTSLSSMCSAIIDASNRNDIKILNLSYSMVNSPVLEEAIKIAEENGVTIAASSGNTNDSVKFPASYPTVIGVGAVNENNQRCSPSDWSNGQGSCFGKDLNLVAPGNKLMAVNFEKSDGYMYVGGTSFSAPIVAGITAVMLGQNEYLSPSEIRYILYTTAQDLGKPGFDEEYGNGLVRMDFAVAKAQEFLNYNGITRLYNIVTGEHLYTADTNEAKSLSIQENWNNEGVKWESPLDGEPVYRLYSPITHNHLYTSDQNEVNTLLNSKAWTIDNDGKAVFYSSGGTGIYRLYNAELKMHLLTTDPVEYKTLSQNKWIQEGAKFNCSLSL